MPKSVVEQIWLDIDKLKALLSGNPHVPIKECRALAASIEEKVIKLRKRELKAGDKNE